MQNHYDFRSFEGCQFVYTIKADGRLLRERTVRSDIRPGERFSICLGELPSQCSMGCYASVRMLDAAGNETGLLQVPLPIPLVVVPPKRDLLPVAVTKKDLVAEGDGFCYRISRKTGMLYSIRYQGMEQPAGETALSCDRASTDNDKSMDPLWHWQDVWRGENLEHTFHKVYDLSVEGPCVTLTASAAGVSRAPYLHYTLRYEFFTDGSVHMVLNGTVRESVTWLPRLGFSFVLPYETDRFSYFGNGPLESYCDMTHHGTIDWHSSCADAEYVPYVRPQEHGNHTATKQLYFPGGLTFSADTEMEICVSHYDTPALQATSHTDELVRSDATHVRVDYKDSGIGSAACGSPLAECYRFSEKKIRFGFTISRHMSP